MAKVRPKKEISDKDRAIGEVVRDTTAPLVVTDAINKLCRRYGTDRVREAVRTWLDFIDSADAKARLDKWEKAEGERGTLDVSRSTPSEPSREGDGKPSLGPEAAL